MTPLVSAILPLYNGSRFVAEAVESVLAQAYPAVEVVVVDDGSTDGGAAVVGRYDGVRLIRQENRGVAAARNRGVAESRGEVLAFLDQDDRWRPGKLAAQVGYLRDHPEAGLVLGHIRPFLDASLDTWPRWHNPSAKGEDVPGMMPGTFVVRRSFFEAVGRFDEAIETASDSEWLLRARRLGGAPHVVPEVVLDYRIHETNQSGQAKHTADLLDVFHAHLRKKREASL